MTTLSDTMMLRDFIANVNKIRSAKKALQKAKKSIWDIPTIGAGFNIPLEHDFLLKALRDRQFRLASTSYWSMKSSGASTGIVSRC